jgi:hypothetical protein
MAAAVDYVTAQIERGDPIGSAVTAVLDDVAEAVEHRGDALLAGSIDRLSATLTVTATPDVVLTDNAEQIMRSVEQYGARSFSVRGSVVDVDIVRGDVQTRASLSFASRDDAGRPRLRIAFECGGDRMVRWAAVPLITGDALARAVEHVFATGQDYEA